jgi:hypothetical protein
MTEQEQLNHVINKRSKIKILDVTNYYNEGQHFVKDNRLSVLKSFLKCTNNGLLLSSSFLVWKILQVKPTQGK